MGEQLTVELLDHIADKYVGLKAVAESKNEPFMDFITFFHKEMRERKKQLGDGILVEA